MFSSRFIGALAIVGASAVQGAPTARDTEPSCMILNSRPGNPVCSSQGYINDDSGKVDMVSVPHISACADACAKKDSCSFFNFIHDFGNCQLFSGDIAAAGFHEDESAPGHFSQLECFQCHTAGTLLAIDFEDDDFSKWSLEEDVNNAFAFDLQNPSSKALRVLEATTTGTGKVQYGDSFNLDAGGTYRLTFLSKTNKPDIQPFDQLRVKIMRGDETVFEAFPEYPVPMLDWMQFASKFKVPEGKGGSAFFSFIVHASGSELDWFFDGIYLQKLF